MRRLVMLAALLFAGACRHETITLETELWHSETCHPEIYYHGNPPNAVAACAWTQVYPPGNGYPIKR